jgi:predicted TPR repeat methyltransferase
MFVNKKFTKLRPEDLLQRAYDVKSPEEAKNLYRDWAGSYDQQLERGLRYVAPTVIAEMLSVAEPDHTVRVLDVGCGTGLVGVSLSELGFVHLDGLDFSSQMLDEARRKGVYRKLIQADLNESLDLAPSTYGAAISCGTFTHGHVDANALDRIATLLKPDAIFACTIHKAVWEVAGFARTLERLGSDGVLVVEEIYERAYFDGSGPDGRFCLLRRCPCNRAVGARKG